MVKDSKLSKTVCAFYEVSSRNLEIARVLLTNLSQRMLSDLKARTTSAERDALLLCVKTIEKEQAFRQGMGHQCMGNGLPESNETNVSSAKHLPQG